MEKAVGSGKYFGKHVRDLLADVSIAYIPFPKNGRDFGANGWGSGKSKLLIAKKNGSWYFYLLETGLWKQKMDQLTKSWFDGLSDDDKNNYKQCFERMAEWGKTYTPPDMEDIRKTKEAISKRTLKFYRWQYQDALLKSMKSDVAELDKAEVIKLFSLFDPDFDNIKNEPNDLNIYGDHDFVFIGDTYSCVAGKEALDFSEAEEVCQRLIAGE